MPRLVNISKALARQQNREAHQHDHIVVEEGPVTNPRAQVPADLFPDVGLKQQLLQSLRLVEAQVVEVQQCLEFGSQFEIDAGAQDMDAGIDEVGLTFLFAAAQIGQQ